MIHGIRRLFIRSYSVKYILIYIYRKIKTINLFCEAYLKYLKSMFAQKIFCFSKKSQQLLHYNAFFSTGNTQLIFGKDFLRYRALCIMKTYINVVSCKQGVLKMFSLKALVRMHLCQNLEEIMRKFCRYNYYI